MIENVEGSKYKYICHNEFCCQDFDWFMIIIMGVLAIPMWWFNIKCLIVACDVIYTINQIKEILADK